MFGVEDIESILGYRIYALIMYGSRVARYASEESDYDYIAVIDGYESPIRYVYREVDGVYISILAVDKSFFEEDVYLGRHGEFVAGRLYGVYRPLRNAEYIRSMEVSLKKRAILEELRMLKLEYGGFLRYMEIPVKYFLLIRLWRRFKVYPPVKYSYYKMFYGSHSSENLRMSLKGFIEACRELEELGILRYSGGYIYNVDVDSIPASLMDILRLLYRGVSMYITHGRSASVGLNIVVEEFRSKVRRGFESLRIPRELENPHILLRLRDAYFTVDHIDVKRLVKAVFGRDAKLVSVRRAGLFSSLKILDVDVDGVRRRLVLKRYPVYSIPLKWIWIYLWLAGFKGFDIEPRARMYREYVGFRELARYGFKTPRIYAVLWRDRAMLIEYIDGVRIDRYEDVSHAYRMLGRLIANIHSRYMRTLGDTKPQNFIISDGSIYMLDLEQYNVDSRYEWDLAELILYSLIFFRRYRVRREVIESTIRGYVEGGGDLETISRLLTPRIIAIFLPLVPTNIFIDLYRAVKDVRSTVVA